MVNELFLSSLAAAERRDSDTLSRVLASLMQPQREALNASWQRAQQIVSTTLIEMSSSLACALMVEPEKEIREAMSHSCEVWLGYVAFCADLPLDPLSLMACIDEEYSAPDASTCVGKTIRRVQELAQFVDTNQKYVNHWYNYFKTIWEESDGDRLS